MVSNFDEKRSEDRNDAERYYSAEVKVNALAPLYHFKIWNISSKGMCLLIREDSEALKYFRVGEVMDIRYYTAELSSLPESLKTEIKHITREKQGRFKGHCLVGLSILQREKPDFENSA